MSCIVGNEGIGRYRMSRGGLEVGQVRVVKPWLGMETYSDNIKILPDVKFIVQKLNDVDGLVEFITEAGERWTTNYYLMITCSKLL